ncbi:sphingomyelin phosphodiesterase 2 isoform X2 [Boleophthalmus pectinirostris]|uniref:sphingomyelin phosphodiesterase 2 isoform X2 n=1 Tax=Boleophthalmus pectinirostris TaxID=150288 RepID=UPI002430C27C|nr:sphingomyelin phosphodiesterase 2 isoform X2 [Boleophthalmus pectinirostris]
MANSAVSIRVFSLNCWGIRYLSKECAQRYAMIGDLLSNGEHDIVLLQEVWSEKDFIGLKKKLVFSHPHSHYFKSGVIGSGLAIFSKHRIHDTFLYRYSLNGYPYMAHHGDWFGGKAVGMAIIQVGNLTANVYVTHLHAEYCREKDSYLPHRVVQAWELQQFIRHTSRGADAVILGGDLNMHPQDLGTRLLRSYTGLRDAYLETSQFDGSLKAEIRCDFMSTTKGSVPDKPFPYSDHEALTADLRLKPLISQETTHDNDSTHDSSKVAELVDILTEARTEVKVGLHCAERMRYTATRTGIMGLALLILELAIAAVPWLALGAEQPFPRTSFYLLAALCCTILITTFLLYLFYTMELKSLQGAEDQMRLAVGGLQERLRGVSVDHTPLRKPPEGEEPSDFDTEE